MGSPLVTDTMPPRPAPLQSVKAKIYLASRYDHLKVMQGFRDYLKMLGYGVTSRWVNGEHELKDADLNQKWVHGVSVAVDEQGIAERRSFAVDDWEDVQAADWVVNFTEAPGSGSTRGGRHVEMGIALGLNKRVIVIGPRENVFHYLPQIALFPSWNDFVRTL